MNSVYSLNNKCLAYMLGFAFITVLICPLPGQKKGWSKKGADVVLSDKNDSFQQMQSASYTTADLQVALNQDKIKSSPLVATFHGDEFPSVVVYSRDGNMYIYNHNGILRPGYPVALNFFGTSTSSPSAGDVDGDGKLEVVICGVSQDLQDLEMVAISPDDNSTIRAKVSSEGDGYFVDRVYPSIVEGGQQEIHRIPYGFNATACIINCKSDTVAEEIVIRDGKGRVNILYWNPDDPNHFTNLYYGLSNQEDYNTAADEHEKDLGEYHRHGPSMSAFSHSDDIVSNFSIFSPSTDGNVYGYSIDGNDFINSAQLPQGVLGTPAGTFPQASQFYASASVIDINGDNLIDLLCASTDGRVFYWRSGGQFAPGWPKQLSQAIISTPIAVDLDENVSGLEVIVGCNDDHVCAFHENGFAVNGWPAQTEGDVFGGVVAGELDGQPGLEVVATALDGAVYVWHADGTRMAGWPKRLDTPLYGSPALADLHKSGRMSVICGGFDGRVFVFDLANLSLDTSQGWLQFGGGIRRQGHPQ